MVRVRDAIAVNRAVYWIHVPDDLGACGKVVGTLVGKPDFLRRSVVVLAANLDREERSAADESHLVGCAGMRVVRNIGAEGFAARWQQRDRVADAIRMGPAEPQLLQVQVQ